MSQQIVAPEPGLREFAELLAPNSRVLDMGSGEGRNANYLALLGHSVFCVERDEDKKTLLIADAIRREIGGLALSNTFLVKGDFRKPMFQEVFDAVICNNALYEVEHKEESSVRAAVPAIQDVTVPGGLNFISCYVGDTLDQRLIPNKTLFMPGEIQKMYEKSGWSTLRDIRVREPLRRKPSSAYKPEYDILSKDTLVARKPGSRPKVTRSYMNANREIFYIEQ